MVVSEKRLCGAFCMRGDAPSSRSTRQTQKYSHFLKEGPATGHASPHACLNPSEKTLIVAGTNPHLTAISVSGLKDFDRI